MHLVLGETWQNMAELPSSDTLNPKHALLHAQLHRVRVGTLGPWLWVQLQD